MPSPTPAQRRRVKKLAQLAEELTETRHGFSTTRLRVVEALCEAQEPARQFALFLTRQLLVQDAEKPRYLEEDAWRRHHQLMERALEAMEEQLQHPLLEAAKALWPLIRELEAEQNEHRNVPFGTVRVIHSRRLWVVEQALRCFSGAPWERQKLAYVAARGFAERYSPHYGNGLIPKSAPYVQQIASFWERYFSDARPLESAERGVDDFHEWLRSKEDDGTVVASFAALAEALGELPEEAQTSEAWWLDTDGPIQRRWAAAGFRLRKVWGERGWVVLERP
jgi:hypothetical protein